jgi:acetyl-CoA carboxylase carboxyltransferase component
MAEIAVMGPKGAAEIIFRKEIESSADRAKALAERESEYREKFANPYMAASRGYIDAIIEPHDTRPRLIRALKLLDGKVDTNPRKKHGNIPL